MAAYNPLSYFSFGKKKEEGTSPSGPNTEPETAAAGSTEQGLPGGSKATSTAAPVMQQAEDAAQQSPAPLLRVVKGNPTDEEVAALTALVHAMQASASAQEQNPILATASRLLNRRQWLGASLKPGPGSWRRARPM